MESKEQLLDMMIAQCAQRALLYEVSVGPKPGLVDRFNSGAHKDMNFFTFIDSAVALIPYFVRCARQGRQCSEEEVDSLLYLLRPFGVEAEKTMLAATGGVNTHKGAIFLLGVLCAAAGCSRDRLFPEQVCCMAARIAALSLNDYKKVSVKPTVGEKLYRSAGCLGVRGEAASGFASVLQYALPLLRKAQQMGETLNDAGVHAILQLMMHVEDTTMINRCGGIEQMHERRQHDFAEYSEKSPLQIATLLDRQWSADGISAGGCADLLGVAFFLFFLEQESGKIEQILLETD